MCQFNHHNVRFNSIVQINLNLKSTLYCMSQSLDILIIITVNTNINDIIPVSYTHLVIIFLCVIYFYINYVCVLYFWPILTNSSPEKFIVWRSLRIYGFSYSLNSWFLQVLPTACTCVASVTDIEPTDTFTSPSLLMLKLTSKFTLLRLEWHVQ